MSVQLLLWSLLLCLAVGSQSCQPSEKTLSVSVEKLDILVSIETGQICQATLGGALWPLTGSIGLVHERTPPSAPAPVVKRCGVHNLGVCVQRSVLAPQTLNPDRGGDPTSPVFLAQLHIDLSPTSDNSSVQWTTTITSPNSSAWSPAIATRLSTVDHKHPFWAPYGGSGSHYTDVLRVLQPTDPPLHLQYGSGFLRYPSSRLMSPVPAMVWAATTVPGLGLGILHAANDTIFGATLDVSASQHNWTRLYNRLGDNGRGNNSKQPSVVSFTSWLFAAAGSDFRGALAVIASAQYFGQYFSASSSASEAIMSAAGLGMYTCAASGSLNVTRLVNESGANMQW